jgi:ectoine hydroxylase-related dioxygenase (phytanoyl-CoA dioxygenase family)|eukprot:COSAG06_NODE_3937_length_4746_cov_15.304231_4_plen_74_part_00
MCSDDPRLLWAGVVHAFGAGSTPNPPHHQVWHRDGPSLFGPWSEAHFHPSHCVNVFIPLVDITKENGPTDFFP